MSKISSAYRSCSEPKKLAFANTVYYSMSADPMFVAYKPEIDELKRFIDAYTVASAEATNGGKDRTREKNLRLDAVVKELNVLANYVTILSRGAELIIWASGFQTVSTVRVSHIVTSLAAPVGLKVVNMEASGVIKMSWTDDKDAAIYGIRRSVGDENVWKNGDYSSTPGETILSGFTPGAKMKFAVQGISENGVTSDFSSTVELWIS